MKPVPRQEKLNYNGRTAACSVETILREKLQRDSVIEEPPQTCKIYLQEGNQILTINAGEKCPPTSGKGRGKEAILKCNRALCPS